MEYEVSINDSACRGIISSSISLGIRSCFHLPTTFRTNVNNFSSYSRSNLDLCHNSSHVILGRVCESVRKNPNQIFKTCFDMLHDNFFPVLSIALGLWQSIIGTNFARLCYLVFLVIILLLLGFLAFFYGRRLSHIADDLDVKSKSAMVVSRVTRSLYLQHVLLWIIVATLIIFQVFASEKPYDYLAVSWILRAEEIAVVTNFILLVSGRTGLTISTGDSTSSQTSFEVHLDMRESYEN